MVLLSKLGFNTFIRNQDLFKRKMSKCSWCLNLTSQMPLLPSITNSVSELILLVATTSSELLRGFIPKKKFAQVRNNMINVHFYNDMILFTSDHR